jgi:hypothetical protein
MTNHLSAAYARNAENFRQMAAKAELTGKKVGGYTLDQLLRSEAEYRRYATMSQPEMDAHQASVRVRVKSELAATV